MWITLITLVSTVHMIVSPAEYINNTNIYRKYVYNIFRVPYIGLHLEICI